MAIEAHLQSLSRRHQELEMALTNELKHAGPDDTKMHELKRLKLRVKDQMAELRRRSDPPR
ncbi:MAG: DUF465 domain-containing protein [Pseudomonadota bacterium]